MNTLLSVLAISAYAISIVFSYYLIRKYERLSILALIVGIIGSNLACFAFCLLRGTSIWYAIPTSLLLGITFPVLSTWIAHLFKQSNSSAIPSGQAF